MNLTLGALLAGMSLTMAVTTCDMFHKRRYVPAALTCFLMVDMELCAIIFAVFAR